MRLVTWLDRVERRWESRRVLALLADHYLIELERVGTRDVRGGGAALQTATAHRCRSTPHNGNLFLRGPSVSQPDHPSSSLRTPGTLVEATIERCDRLDLVVSHDSDVNGVAGRQPSDFGEEVARTVGIGERDIEDHRACLDEQIVDSTSQFAPPERRIPIQDLLKHFGARAAVDRAVAHPFQKRP